MSVLLIDDVVTTASRPAPTGTWRPVPRRVSQGQPRPTPAGSPDRPGVASGGVGIGGRPHLARAARQTAPRPTLASQVRAPGWQLTDRGLAVAVALFLAVCATAAVVLIVGFLSVSNASPTSVPSAATVGTQW